mgnify:CR=1 FL=1
MGSPYAAGSSGSDEAVLSGRPFSVSMGLRTLDLADWLIVDERRDDELALKQELLTERHDDYLAESVSGARLR